MVSGRRRVPLQDWQFKAQGSDVPNTVKFWRPALAPPSTCHQDLLAEKLIPDPFLAKQEEDVQWIGEHRWSYRTTFRMPVDVGNGPGLTKHLVFEGLDTYATVWLNGHHVLEADNMFLTHRIDISVRVLSNGATNSLEILFDNAEKRGDEEVEAHPESKWMTFNSGEARLATRKAQYHYGWDWGPKLMTCGIWRPIYIEVFESRISDISVQSSVSPNHGEASLHVDVEVEGSASQVILSAELNNTVLSSRTIDTNLGDVLKSELKIPNPELWWPHTLGQQPLYLITATLLEDGMICDKQTKRIGIRTVELVQQSFADEEGSSFFFKINGTPVFSAGSNWIPGDSLLPRITASKYRRWIELAKASNQTMIRVWGGGIYEDEEFYNACDEFGILVWQDFMLACGMFPTHQSFLDRITREAEDNLRKLRHHPSIVLWCGNNEDYVIPLISAIEYDHNDHDPQSILGSEFPSRYIYEHLLPPICSKLIPNVPYWPGSPFGGEMVNTTTEGDVHQWHVWHLEKFPYQDFPELRGRFISEFGMQGMPCLRTCRDFFLPGDKLENGRDYAADEFVQFHNKCVGGSETLHEYCENNIPIETRNLRRYIHATQLIQSETVATAYRSWRRWWRGEGREYCGGALIWQLNDVWPVTSWALVDSHFRPKMGYWAMKRENRPITAGSQRVASKEDHSTKVQVWAVNTSLRSVRVDVRLRVWRVQGGEALFERMLHQGITLPANQSIELNNIDFSSFNLPTSTKFEDVVSAVDLLTCERSFNPNFPDRIPDKGTLFSQSISFHEPLKEVAFVQPSRLNVQISKDSGQVVVELESSAALKGVLLEIVDDDRNADSVSWDDNGFDLLPEEITRIGVAGLEPGEEGRLQITWLGGQWAATQLEPVKSML